MQKKVGMMEMIWTEDQIKAMEYTGTNVLVAAAAGSGKTAVLVERIINQIVNEGQEVDIDRLLVVTFTNGAAAEMKERIGLAIEQKLLADPGNDRLKRQQTLLPKANIMTIHAFCLRVIRSHFHVLDIDPSFRIADQAECSLLKDQAAEELFEEMVFGDDMKRDTLSDLMAMYGGKDGGKLKELILSVHRTVQSNPAPGKWLDRQVELYQTCHLTDFSKSLWGTEIIRYARDRLELAQEKYKKAIRLALDYECDEKSAEILKVELAALEHFHEKTAQGWDECVRAANMLDFPVLRLKTGNEQAKEDIRLLRNEGKSIGVKLRDTYFVSSEKEVLEELQILGPVLKELVSLVKRFEDKYGRLKKEKNCIDFNDIEHFCLELLTKAEIAAEYRQLFQEILIDEYQDSNLIQEYILRAVSKYPDAGNIFMVGDVKQSIYRFRQAMPELFLQKYNDYTTENGDQNRKVLLYENFRSRKEILHAVNYIFERIMSLKVGEIDYNQIERLNPAADYADMGTVPRVSLEIIETDEPDSPETADDTGEEIEIPEKIRGEARLTAEKIIAAVSDEAFTVTDKKTGKQRRIKYGDIVILMRSTKNTAEVFHEECAAAGIPVYSDGDSGYFEANEVKTVVGLLNVINNPLQDIYLLTVLCAPFYSFTANELAEIASNGHEGPFYGSLCQYGSDKAVKFLNDLKRWRRLARILPSSELLWMLYEETGYYGYVGGLYDGEKRQANLRLLYERTKEFEKTGFFGLTRLLDYIEKIRVSSNDFGEAKTISEDNNVVRIMSIHKSKGLEFPVVFIGGLGRKFNMADMRKDMLVHQDKGFGPEFFNINRGNHYPAMAKLAVQCVVKKELLSEELRVLYVALTRAKEYLFLVGSCGGLEKIRNKYRNEYETPGKLPGYVTMNAMSYLDWIIMADPAACPVMDISTHSVSRFSVSREEDDPDFNEASGRLEGKTDEYIYRNIDSELRWKYPYMEDTVTPAKISVTEAVKLTGPDTDYIESPFDLKGQLTKPKFLKEKGLSAGEVGTAYHLFLKQLPLNITSLDEIKSCARSLLERNMLTKKELDSIDLKKIERFIRSDIYARACKSIRMEREIPFHVYHAEKGYLIQGVIDMFFEEDDGIVLVDYKTNDVNESNLDALTEKYMPQLELYRYALEKLTGKQVKEKHIEWVIFPEIM